MTTFAGDATDSTTLTDTTPTNITGECVIAETSTLTDSLDVFKQLLDTLAETINAAPVTIGNVTGDSTASTGVIASTTLVGNQAFFAVLTETGTFTESVTPNAILNLLATEGGSFTAMLVIGGEEFVVWVANADTFAHSQYAGFNFNSMCRLGNHYYGAKDDGIYLLEGDDDAGTDVQYFLTLPTTEFGTAKQKRVPKCYMGSSNDGDMHIKVITREGIARVYSFAKLSQGYSESGAAMGRGIKSRYFTFDLYSVSGGDVELEHIEFFPVILSRMMNS